MTKLTIKQQKFADEYIISGNATQAVEYIKHVLMAKGGYISYMDVIDSVATIASAYTTPIQKQASKLIMRYVFGARRANDIVEDMAVVTDREDALVRRWRNKVLKRDSYTCQHCGSTSDLTAHHISYWSNDPVNRINVDNGITLCRECHAFEHRGETVYNLLAKKR
ncbi:HNH endonuclease [Lentilactobacillus buchneri]|uniref:HNH endonuclease n=1 Tax=Lentilactobacillus buchneri TaxID=1581 RepID=UPI00165E8121|nr:HNH endonuclease [Lentilactobacillus buchneri]